MINKKILLVDDCGLTLNSTKRIIRNHGSFEVITTDSPLYAIRLLRTQTIDLVVSDMRIPETHRLHEIQGFELLSIIKTDFPKIKTLFYTIDGSEYAIVNAFEMGCCDGYVIKGRKGSEMLLKAIDSIFEKGIFINDYISSILKKKESQKKIFENLTEEEMEIIKLLSSGLSDKEIVTEMQISISLFEKRMLKMFEKFNVRNKAQMICYVIENNLLEL